MSDALQELEAEKRSNRRRWWVLLGIVGVVIAGIVFLLFRDDPPPDDSWMLPKFTAGGGERNPLVLFTEEIANLDADGAWSKLSREVRELKPGSESEAEAALAKYEDHIASLHKLMLTDVATWRWPGGESMARFDADLKYLTDCQSLMNICKLRVRLLARNGRIPEAIEESLRIARFGAGISDAQGAFIHWLVGITGIRIGETALEAALTAGSVDAARLDGVQRELSALEIPPNGLQFAAQMEYLSFKRMMQDLITGNASPGIAGFPPGASLFLLKRNTTLGNHLEFDKPVARALEGGDTAEILSAAKEWDQKIEYMRNHRVRILVSPNMAGNLFISLSLPTQSSILKRYIVTLALHRQSIMMVALRRYELEHGRLPENPGELAPNYLAEIPQDPVDKAPMRWNRASDALYSIGVDLKDDHGNFQKISKSSDPDIGMRYWWRGADDASPAAGTK